MIYGNEMLWSTEGGSTLSTLLNGIQGYYKFDELSGTTAIDEVGTANGTLTSANFQSDGKINYSVESNATTDHISMGNNFNFDYNDPFTYNIWIKRTSTGGIKMILSKYAGATQSMYIFFNSDRVEFNLVHTGGTNAITISTSTTYTDTTNWNMYTFTYDGSADASGVKFYFNNVLQTWATIHYNNLSFTILNTGNFEVGSRNTNSFGLLGKMDELGIWNRVLSTSERGELYADGVGNQYPFPLPIISDLETDLVGYYKLDETSGTTASSEVGAVSGTLTESVFNASGKINYGSYNASSDTGTGINFGDNFGPEYNLPKSYNFWIKQLNGDNFMLITKQDATANARGFYVGVNTDGNIFMLHQSSTGNSIARSVGTDIDGSLNVWKMITLTWDGSGNASGWNHYVNGVKGSWTTTSDTLTATTDNTVSLSLGAWNKSTGWSLQGYQDEFGIWDRELSQADIDLLYNAGAGLQYPF